MAANQGEGYKRDRGRRTKDPGQAFGSEQIAELRKDRHYHSPDCKSEDQILHVTRTDEREAFG
jgi:hypothetical protein